MTTVVDATCAAAEDTARAAAVAEAGPGSVGAYLGVEADGERLATHLFECLDAGYVGWRWGVQVVRASRARDVTVNGVYRLPGPDAMLAPPWVPWAERLRPGDLGVGDLLPAPPDDDRLALAVTDVDADVPWLGWGIGRPRVLSFIGRTEAAERWYDGDPGPDNPHAKAAPARCQTCGFFVPLVGALGDGFGACANEFAPDDGRVVAVDHGCGAHSEGSADVAALGPAPALVDEYSFEPVVVEPAADDVETADAAADYAPVDDAPADDDVADDAPVDYAADDDAGAPADDEA